jgi:hypothetical protein
MFRHFPLAQWCEIIQNVTVAIPSLELLAVEIPGFHNLLWRVGETLDDVKASRSGLMQSINMKGRFYSTMDHLVEKSLQSAAIKPFFV